MIKLKRDSGYADSLRAYHVFVDGRDVGEIRDAQEVELNVSPGKHQLQLKIDWGTSNVVEFESGSDLIEFECGSNLRGLRVVLSLFYATFLSDQYIWLKQKT